MSTVDASGYGNTSMHVAPTKELPRDVQVQPAVVDAQGFSNVASVLTRRNASAHEAPKLA